jgi:ketosteroid isomerase-like protein
VRVLVLLIAALLVGNPSLSSADEFDAEEFAHNYFEAWAATQSPQATQEDLEHYLSFLADDVGHEHIPFDTDDSRSPDGKQSIREGMTSYLGKHIEYRAKLVGVTYGLDAIAIQFEVFVKAKRGPDEPISSMTFNSLELLEIEDGKVSVIRKYN